MCPFLYYDADILSILVNYGAALDSVDRDGHTAVHSAILGKKKDNVEYLLSLGIPIGDSLSCAAENTDVAMLAFLLNHGAPLDGVCNYGATAVECAIIGRKKENVEYLLSLGSPAGKNSLFHAALFTDVSVLTILVNHGVALDGVNRDGDTAVERALLAGKKKNAEYLFDLGVPLGKTPLACAVLSKEYGISRYEGNEEGVEETEEEKILALIRFILSQRPSLVDAPRNGETAHELAVARGYQSVVELLDSRACRVCI